MYKNILVFAYSLFIALTTFTIAMACGCGCMGGNCGASNTVPAQVQQTESKVQCPVMKTWILASEASDKTEYNGKSYYFCCPGCKEQFLKNPDKYIEPEIKS
jgi:YHS domain-containing protein